MPNFYNSKGKVFKTARYKDGALKGGLPRISEISKYMEAKDLLELAAHMGDKFTAFMEEQGKLGTQAHAFIEDVIDRKKTPRVGDKIKDIAPNLKKNVLKLEAELLADGWRWDKKEFTVLNFEHCFAGRCDARMVNANGRHLYIDWKTQSFRATGKDAEPKADFSRKSYVLQLAAYAMGDEDAQLMLAAVDKKTGNIQTKTYTDAKKRWAEQCFLANLQAFFLWHEYDKEKAKEIFKKSFDKKEKMIK